MGHSRSQKPRTSTPTEGAGDRRGPTPHLPLIVVAYFTLDTPYEVEVENLRKSLEGLSLASDIVSVPNLGSWQANTQYKAVFLRKMLCRHGASHRLLYVDADAIIRRHPSLLDNACCDIGIHFTPRSPLSGTIYLEATARTCSLMDAWVDANQAHPDLWDQVNLGTVIREHEERYGLRVLRLPVEYTFIFDLARRRHPHAQPVIEHFQASRRFRKAVER